MPRLSLPLLDVMSKLLDWPASQAVPAASSCTTDQAPLAHCWNDVPPIQFQSPSGVQAEPGVSSPVVVPEVLVLVLVLADAELVDEVAELAATDATGATEATSEVAAVVVVA